MKKEKAIKNDCLGKNCDYSCGGIPQKFIRKGDYIMKRILAFVKASEYNIRQGAEA